MSELLCYSLHISPPHALKSVTNLYKSLYNIYKYLLRLYSVSTNIYKYIQISTLSLPHLYSVGL